ncbi:MAG: MFS transporter, partial [Salinibacterium sp.]|nr:MFS transporter [Salinibacterium sp.]
LFLWMVPLALAAFVLLAFLKEVPLATTINRDEVMENSVAEGNLLIAGEGAGDGTRAAEHLRE